MTLVQWYGECAECSSSSSSSAATEIPLGQWEVEAFRGRADAGPTAADGSPSQKTRNSVWRPGGRRHPTRHMPNTGEARASAHDTHSQTDTQTGTSPCLFCTPPPRRWQHSPPAA